VTALLLVEDDPQVRGALRITLAARGYRVTEAATGALALSSFKSSPTDIVILDLGLPDVDGLEVLRQIRAVSDTPVIVLSARTDRYDKIISLDSGADDYVTKPFDFEELLARVRAALRRAEPAHGAPTLFTSHFTLDLARKDLTLASGEGVRLTPTEWGFLEVLARSQGMVVTGQEILREVWGPGYGTETNYLRVYAAQLRKKIEPDPAHPRYLITIPGVGYRLDVDSPTKL
jgi:two-component system KDP operon response regulator KdpE